MDHEESVLSSFSLLSPTGLNMADYKPNPQLQSMNTTIIPNSLKPKRLNKKKE
jgi:hypothetical protein